MSGNQRILQNVASKKKVITRHKMSRFVLWHFDCQIQRRPRFQLMQMWHFHDYDTFEVCDENIRQKSNHTQCI